jgi:predicted transposase YdaD
MPKNNKQKKGSSKINNPHDKFFRATFSMLTVVKGYFIEVFPQNLTDKLDLDTLVLDPNAYITKDLAGYYSDLVWRCHLKSGQLTTCSFFI